MPPIFACLAGGPLRRALEAGRLKAQPVAATATPFGDSESILRVENGPVPFYIVPRELPGRRRRAPAAVNYRATLYALKDLGVGCVLCWSE